MGNKKDDESWRDEKEIYALLKDGKGRASITVRNVDSLKTLALADENEVVLQILKNWR